LLTNGGAQLSLRKVNDSLVLRLQNRKKGMKKEKGTAATSKHKKIVYYSIK
jgi:hypothetical protein